MMNPDDTQPADAMSLSRLLGLKPDDEVQLGTVIEGRYRLDERLGKGGMGVVYRARQLNAQRDVALKVMTYPRDGNDEARRRRAKRFEREVMTTAKLEHPHIVRLYDVGTTDDGEIYMAMELVEGLTLRELIADEAPLTPQRVADLGVQLASALQAAHDAGVVHRDLKPDNIMVGKPLEDGETLTVLDFGLAQLAASDEERLTRDGFLLGTPAYAAPEQARGHAVDHRADLYATGAILYEALTGHPVFKGRTALDVMHQHTHARAPRASDTIEVPRWLDGLVRELLAKDPKHRPQSAEILKRRLQEGEDRADPTLRLKWLMLFAALAVIGIAIPHVMGPNKPPSAAPQSVTKSLSDATEPSSKATPTGRNEDARTNDVSATADVGTLTDTSAQEAALASFDKGSIHAFRFDSRKRVCRFTVTTRSKTQLLILLKDASNAALDSYRESFEATHLQRVSVTFKKPTSSDGNLRCELFDERGNLIAIPGGGTP